VNKVDMNANGFIDYTEFLAGCMRSKIYLKEDHLRAAFNYFDKVRNKFKTNIFIRTVVEQ
jgi:Ca2+-binding EF-hand superfamily protein